MSLLLTLHDSEPVHVQPDVEESRLFWVYDLECSWLDPDEGRDAAATSIAERSRMTPEELRDFAENYTERTAQNLREKGRPVPGHYYVTATLRRRAEWWLRWFNHFTYDEGQSDEEFRTSFERYVRWAEELNRHHSDYSGAVPIPAVVLMCAEDRYRWHGAKPDDPPPCRCEHCTKWGVVGINH